MAMNKSDPVPALRVKPLRNTTGLRGLSLPMNTSASNKAFEFCGCFELFRKEDFLPEPSPAIELRKRKA